MPIIVHFFYFLCSFKENLLYSVIDELLIIKKNCTLFLNISLNYVFKYKFYLKIFSKIKK